MYLEKKKNTWYAVLTKPVDVWPNLGRSRWFKSTQTGDKSKAQIRAAAMVGVWKAEIAKVRGTMPTPTDGLWEDLRRDFIAAKQAEGDDDGEAVTAVLRVIEAAALKIADPDESSRQYRVATGQAAALVPLNPLVTAWKGSLRLAQKTIDQQGRDVQRMADHFKHLEALTPQKIKAWTDTQRAQGVTASSFERIGNGCRSFWSYLQDSGAKSIVDPDPFVGPFRLAQKTAKKTNTGRSGSSYTPEQLAALYVGALSNNDQPLADLIALGAYTGARIEELCKLTKETAKDGVFSMGTKTKASQRDCPIHPAVAPLVARLIAASSDGFLVPSTAENQYGNRSGPLSQRFGHLKTAQGFGTAHVFHSTRNTLATMMERAGVPEGIAADIVGHDKKTMTYGLYSSGSAKEQKLAAISTVAYPAPLDLT